MDIYSYAGKYICRIECVWFILSGWPFILSEWPYYQGLSLMISIVGQSCLSVILSPRSWLIFAMFSHLRSCFLMLSPSPPFCGTLLSHLITYAHIFFFFTTIMPGDLNLKKSWNPALVKNQTKLWKQEQKTLEEYKQIKLREDELAKEQESLHLISLKNKHNQSLTTEDKLKLNKLDWMYDGPVGVEQVSSSKAEPQGASVQKDHVNGTADDYKKNRNQKLDSMDPMLKVTSSAVGKVASDKVSSRKSIADMDPMNLMRLVKLMKPERTRERSPTRGDRTHEIGSERDRESSDGYQRHRSRHRNHHGSRHKSDHSSHRSSHRSSHKHHKHKTHKTHIHNSTPTDTNSPTPNKVPY